MFHAPHYTDFSINTASTWMHQLAEIGHTACLKSRADFSRSVIYTIGVDILLIGAAVVAGVSFPPAIPIIACTAAVCLIAFNVYQVYQLQQMPLAPAPFDLMFKTILEKDYSLAWEQFEQILNPDSTDTAGTTVHIKFPKLFPHKLVLHKFDDPSCDFHPKLALFLVLLNAHRVYQLASDKDANQKQELLKQLSEKVKDYNAITGRPPKMNIEKLIQEPILDDVEA